MFCGSKNFAAIYLTFFRSKIWWSIHHNDNENQPAFLSSSLPSPSSSCVVFLSFLFLVKEINTSVKYLVKYLMRAIKSFMPCFLIFYAFFWCALLGCFHIKKLTPSDECNKLIELYESPLIGNKIWFSFFFSWFFFFFNSEAGRRLEKRRESFSLEIKFFISFFSFLVSSTLAYRYKTSCLTRSSCLTESCKGEGIGRK